jgi:hypothetical protein
MNHLTYLAAQEHSRELGRQMASARRTSGNRKRSLPTLPGVPRVTRIAFWRSHDCSPNY